MCGPWNLLCPIGLSLYFHLQTEWIFTGTNIWWVTVWAVIYVIDLYLMCFGSSKFVLWMLFPLETLTVKCPNLWHALHWYFLAGHVNPSWWAVSLHFEHLLKLFEGGGLFEVGGLWSPLFLYGIWPWYWSFLHGLLLPGLGFVWDHFFLYLWWCNLVLWCCSRLIWVAWGSPDTCFICLAVAFELSSFLASWILCLQGICPSQHFHHWWSWTQNLHLSIKTKRCPYGVFWLFLGVIGQIHLPLYGVIPLINTMVSLSETCQ